MILSEQDDVAGTGGSSHCCFESASDTDWNDS